MDMSYIDAFVCAVATNNKTAYVDGSKMFGGLVKEYGALALHEFWGDDVPDGQLTSFPMAVKLQPGETVVLSYVEWPDKATRDANAKMMQDPRMNPANMPFDGKRMIYGGFAPL
jgi:uncharacterized protein YbaA (DUF1428 family)